MIKINLAKRKQASSVVSEAAAGGGGGGGVSGALGGFKLPMGLARITLDGDQLRELPYKKFVVAIVVAVAANYFVENQKEVEMQKATEKVTELIGERTRLSASASKIKSYEALKRSMEQDEATIRGKIETIQKLLTDRQNPPKLLRSLASAIPKEVWLSDFKVGDKEISLKGFGLEIPQITTFISALNDTAYFKDVIQRNGSSMSGVKDETGVDVFNMDLVGTRR